MLIEVYGKKCEHCRIMEPLIEQLQKETGAKLERNETWHNEENAEKINGYDKDSACSGVPFLYQYRNGENDLRRNFLRKVEALERSSESLRVIPFP